MENRIIYSLNIEDLQTVAENELNRKLNDEEIEYMENNLYKYIDWYMAIELTLMDLKRINNLSSQ